jgi:hypothetical protein
VAAGVQLNLPNVWKGKALISQYSTKAIADLTGLSIGPIPAILPMVSLESFQQDFIWLCSAAT